MNERIRLLLISLAALLVVPGCGGSNSQDETPSDDTDLEWNSGNWDEGNWQ